MDALMGRGLADFCEQIHKDSLLSTQTFEGQDRLAHLIVGYQRYSPLALAMEIVASRHQRTYLYQVNPASQEGLNRKIQALEAQLRAYESSGSMLRAAGHLWKAQQQMRQTYTGAIALGRAQAFHDNTGYV